MLLDVKRNEPQEARAGIGNLAPPGVRRPAERRAVVGARRFCRLRHDSCEHAGRPFGHASAKPEDENLVLRVRDPRPSIHSRALVEPSGCASHGAQALYPEGTSVPDASRDAVERGVEGGGERRGQETPKTDRARQAQRYRGSSRGGNHHRDELPLWRLEGRSSRGRSTHGLLTISRVFYRALMSNDVPWNFDLQIGFGFVY